MRMLSILSSIFVDRRKKVQPIECERRRVTRKEADMRLRCAVNDFNATVTIAPERVKELLQRAAK